MDTTNILRLNSSRFLGGKITTITEIIGIMIAFVRRHLDRLQYAHISLWFDHHTQHHHLHNRRQGVILSKKNISEWYFFCQQQCEEREEWKFSIHSLIQWNSMTWKALYTSEGVFFYETIIIHLNETTSTENSYKRCLFDVKTLKWKKILKNNNSNSTDNQLIFQDKQQNYVHNCRVRK